MKKIEVNKPSYRYFVYFCIIIAEMHDQDLQNDSMKFKKLKIKI